jgi:hypothetical protein
MDLLLDTEEAARMLGYAPKTLRNLKALGIGPRFRKLPSGGVRYTAADLRAWVHNGVTQ